MRSKVLISGALLLGAYLLLWGGNWGVPVSPEEQKATPQVLTKFDVGLTTSTWGIFDPKTGEIIAGNNLVLEHPIASVTKLFTAYAVMESSKKNESMTISWSDLNTEGRAGKLQYGERMTLNELLFPLLIESSNDAGEVIRRSLDSEFANSVTTLKTELKLEHTYIADTTGLSDNNISNVNDLAKFYTHLRKEYPHITDITQLRLYIGKNTGWVNNDPARELSSFTGGKHGFTESAGRTFVGTFKTKENDTEIGVILLGSSNLRIDIDMALEYFENNPELSICYNAGTCPQVQDVVSFNPETR